jgi:hypothetical protein
VKCNACEGYYQVEESVENLFDTYDEWSFWIDSIVCYFDCVCVIYQ